MTLETERLILRPWKEDDAESLYKYAKNPEVGPIAGWPVHTSVENSREIIKSVLAADETYAVCLREDNVAIGSIGLITPAQSHTKAADDEIEIGYWIGVPYWGQGLIPEAVRALQKHAFLDLGCSAMWCGYYDGNEKSKRCQEKCGFKYHPTEENKPCALMGDVRTEHFTYLTKEQWSDTQDEQKVNSSLHNCQKGYASVNEKRMNMLIDFDGLTIIIGIVIYILICIFIHKKYKKEKIYYVFSTIMFCYFMCIAKLTLFPIVMIGLPANIKESINIIPFHNGINRTDILNLIMTIPLGIGIPFITKINNIKKILLLGLCFGLGIETIQYLETFLTKGFSHRIIDINDVIFNFTGTVIGFFVLYVFSRLFIKMKEENLNAFWKHVYKTCDSVSIK